VEKIIHILQKHYDKKSKLYEILIEHSTAVMKKSLEIAQNYGIEKVDYEFIREAAMLHDIGIYLTNAPVINCFGNKPYICHGYLGREILEKEGLPKHALVCERHSGVGINLQDIFEKRLPLPKRDLLPISKEEKIICIADKFFSKLQSNLGKEKELTEVRNSIKKYGANKLEIFDSLLVEFKVTYRKPNN
jgi:uncharacterized protein